MHYNQFLKMWGNPVLLTLPFIFAFVSLFLSANAQQTNISKANPLQMTTILKQGPEYELINPLVGKWSVEQTIYKKNSDELLSRNTFQVERKMIGNFLQEIMKPLSENEEDQFQRISYLSYNRTNRRWEYIVLDTRFPLMMYEESVDHKAKNNAIHLYKDNFIAPPFWGLEYAGQLTKQHRIIRFGEDKNTNEQYWTLPGEDEFLAIKYVYKRIE